MAAARADAAAQTQEAQLGLLRAQYELAALMRAAAGTPLPLPADRPHVGPYRTDFKAMFADRTPPEPARLADRILPVQWRQVDQASHGRASGRGTFWRPRRMIIEAGAVPRPWSRAAGNCCGSSGR